MTFYQTIRKYWLLQGFVITVLVGYILVMTIGFLFILNSGGISDQSRDKVTILLIIESHNPDFPINFSNTSIIAKNTTLLDHLNRTIGRENWNGFKYPIGGWYIQEFFNISETGVWHWFIYYRVSGVPNWSLSPVGVSYFVLDQDYDIKFIFENS